jgi:hypothetical protein
MAIFGDESTSQDAYVKADNEADIPEPILSCQKHVSQVLANFT